jgi:hypothetical protein
MESLACDMKYARIVYSMDEEWRALKLNIRSSEISLFVTKLHQDHLPL